MQLYFLEHLKVKEKKKRALLFDLHKAGCAMFTVQGWATEPALSFYLSISSSISFYLFLSLYLSCGAVDLGYIPFNANFSDPPCCDVVDKLQWSGFNFLFFFCTHLFK